MKILSYENFLKTATTVLTEANNANQNSAVILIDFEGLPALDGILGYEIVDKILDQLTQLLGETLNTTDFIGQIGRYQVCCLLSNLLTLNHALLATHKILRLLKTLNRFNKRRISLLPRIGVVTNETKKENLKQLMCNANSALHQAKSNRKPLHLFAEDNKDQSLSSIDIWSDLDHAINAGELELVYQPQLCISTGKIQSAEALLRWNHPILGLIAPDKLIQLIEGTELMIKLTLWVFNTALRQCAEYRRLGLDAGVSINLSADDLSDPELVELIEQAVNIWNISPSNVMIELTETAIMGNQLDSLETLFELRNFGFKLAMDDFGTGYSSMERLLQLPLNEIKIDKTFVQHLSTQSTHERIVSSMINLGHQLELQVIAEGVEDLATYEHLEGMKCDIIQGYFVGAGMPFNDLIKLNHQLNTQSFAEFISTKS